MEAPRLTIDDPELERFIREEAARSAQRGGIHPFPVRPDAKVVTQHGAVRVARQPAYPNRLGTTAHVRIVVAQFCRDGRHEFCADDISPFSA